MPGEQPDPAVALLAREEGLRQAGGAEKRMCGGGAGRPGEATDDWADDRNKLRDKRAKKKTTTGVKAPGTAWDEDLRMRAPVKREKRESGKSWRDYTVEEDVGDVELDDDGVPVVPPSEEGAAVDEEGNGVVEVDVDSEAAEDEDDEADDEDDDSDG